MVVDGSVSRAERSQREHRIRVAESSATESQREHYKTIADEINKQDGILQKSWNFIAKGLFNVPFVTPELVEQVAVTGSLPPLDLTNLKGPSGIIAAEAFLGSGIGYAALITILAGAGIAIPIVGIGAAGVSAVLLYKAVRFRHDHETEIENLIKTTLYSKNNTIRDGENLRRTKNEVIKEMDAYQKAEHSFAQHGFIQQGNNFRAMLERLHNFAVTQRSNETRFNKDEQDSLDDEQNEALFVMKYLEENGVINTKSKSNGYFEPGENFIVFGRQGQAHYDESERVSLRISDYIDSALKDYEKDKKRRKHS